MRKLCSKWISRLLTVDQKQQRVDDSERSLEPFQQNKQDFFIVPQSEIRLSIPVKRVEHQVFYPWQENSIFDPFHRHRNSNSNYRYDKKLYACDSCRDNDFTCVISALASLGKLTSHS